jgi:CRISPR-associated endonuclease/helicase Cas3
VLVFCHSRDVANKTAGKLRTLLKPGKERADDVELITGARRGYERDKLVETPTYQAFHGKMPEDGRTRYLVCTAAGEVGADLDADAAVMDLVPLERMVQRLGRVNRRGECKTLAPVSIFYDSETLIVSEAEKDEEKKAEAARRAATRTALAQLPQIGDGGVDASPLRIGELLDELGTSGRDATFSPPPKLIPVIERDHVEAWALTSVEDHPGRPDVAPFIRGVEDEEPQTTVAWRVDVPYLSLLPDKAIEKALAAAPLRPAEVLEAPTREVAEVLQKRIASLRKAWDKAELDGRLNEAPVLRLLLLRGGRVVEKGRIERETAVLGRVPLNDIKRTADRLRGATLLIEPPIGGLDDRGALADEEERPAQMHVEPNMLIRLVPPHEDEEKVPRLLALSNRLRHGDPEIQLAPVSEGDARQAHPRGLRPVWTARLPARAEDEDADGDALEYWSALWSFDGETAAASKREQFLTEHHHWAAAEMLCTAERLGLPPALSDCLVRAIALHDHGKGRRTWRRAAGAPLFGEALAKTRSSRMGELGGYRHEFGSLRGTRWIPPGIRPTWRHSTTTYESSPCT